MNRKGELICAWMGPVGIVLFGIGWIAIAGWFQPPLPNYGAAEIAQIFQQKTNAIRLGMVFVQYGGVLTLAFCAAITVVMLRMKGPSPALAYIQLGCAICNTMVFIVPGQMFNATAYRPERPVDITQFGFDLGMLSFDSVGAPALVQFAVIGMAILYDQSERPTFPRWFAYFCFWGGLLFVPSTIVCFFKQGPFTWSGLLGWYLGVVVFCGWFLAMFPLLLKAIKQQVRTAEAAPV